MCSGVHGGPMARRCGRSPPPERYRPSRQRAPDIGPRGASGAVFRSRSTGWLAHARAMPPTGLRRAPPGLPPPPGAVARTIHTFAQLSTSCGLPKGFGQPLQPPSNAAERRARCLAGARAAPRPQPRSVPRLACRSRRRATANSAPWRSAGCACTLAILCTSPDPIPEQACEGVGGSRATRWPLRAAGHVACCCCARGERCAGEVAAADAHGHARSPYSPSIAGWPRCCRRLCCLLWMPGWSVGRRVARRARRWACVRWIARAACTVWDCATHARAGALPVPLLPVASPEVSTVVRCF